MYFNNIFFLFYFQKMDDSLSNISYHRDLSLNDSECSSDPEDSENNAFVSFNIDFPFSPYLYYHSVRGAENFHIYLWIAMDLGKDRFPLPQHYLSLLFV